jgi:hypothetical protein
MVTTRVKPRGAFNACKHPCVFVDIRAGIPAKMVVVIWRRLDDVSSQLSGYWNLVEVASKSSAFQGECDVISFLFSNKLRACARRALLEKQVFQSR